MMRFGLTLSTLLISLAATACAAGDFRPVAPAGFTVERVASVAGARELSAGPHGELYVGTSGSDVYVIHDAGAARPAAPAVFAHFADGPAAGVSAGTSTLYVGTQFGVYAVPLGRDGATPKLLARVRTSGESRDHLTTSVAFDGSTLYVSVGSSCNACRPELDPTRASIFRLDPHAEHPQLQRQAERIRNAIALAIAPDDRTLWAGVAGVDDLPPQHPYEIFDAVTLHPGVADYGWPSCYENRRSNPAWPGSCAQTALPRVVFPAYETPVGAAFYPVRENGRYAFPSRYRGGAFVALHGSWHGPGQGLTGYVPPRVAFVPMNGDEPVHAVKWSDPSAQWTEFLSGYQQGGSAIRNGRPTGVAVGNDGSLFVADDEAGAVYRIRPSGR